MHPGLGQRLLLVPSPCPALTARDPLSDIVSPLRLLLTAGSSSPSKVGVDVAVAGEVAALSVDREVPTCLSDVVSLFSVV